MILKLGDWEHTIANFNLQIVPNNFTLDDIERRQRLMVRFENDLDLDLDTLADDINDNFNGELEFLTEYKNYKFTDYVFQDLSMQIGNNQFDISANFYKNGTNPEKGEE